MRVSFDGQGHRLDTSEDAEVICEQLRDKDVEILILQGNTFGIEAAERVGIELSKQPALTEAHFKDLFTSRGRDEVPEALRHLLKGISDSGAQLTLLDLSDNAIGPIGAPSVIEFLETPSAETIQKLYLHNCGLGPEGSTSIAAKIPLLKNLRELRCGRNRLENKGATNLSAALSVLNTLELIVVNQNGIHVKGITQLVGALKANIETIRTVDFSDNTVKEEGCRALADAIIKSKNLMELRLDDALIQNEGFRIICDALSKSPSLETIETVSFEGNELYGQKLVDLIESTFSTREGDFCLDLLENEFSPTEKVRLNDLSTRFDILVDDIDSDDEVVEGSLTDTTEDVFDEDAGRLVNGYIDTDFREVCLELIEAVNSKEIDDNKRNTAFVQMISMGAKNIESSFGAVQILCEELGLVKPETTRKRKPLARETIVYLGMRRDDLPRRFRDFIEVVTKNNDELSCGKLLFQDNGI